MAKQRVDGVRDAVDPPVPRSKGAPLGSVVSRHGGWKAERFSDGRTVQALTLQEDSTVDLGPGGDADGRKGEVVVRYGGDIPDTIMTAECFKRLCGKP